MSRCGKLYSCKYCGKLGYRQVLRLHIRTNHHSEWSNSIETTAKGDPTGKKLKLSALMELVR